MKTKFDWSESDLGSWNCIAEMGWGTKSTDYNAISRTALATFGYQRMLELRKFISSLIGRLHRTIATYEDHNGNLNIGSDDGMSDVLHHIVGLGRKEFEKCIDNPALIEERYNNPHGSPDGYTESFAYCFLNLKPTEAPLSPVQVCSKTIQRELVALLDFLSADMQDRVREIVKKNFEGLPK